MKLFVKLFFLFSPSLLIAQTFLHDHCEHALELVPGQAIPVQNNERASITALETPLPHPQSCIRTFENDLWYAFTSDSSNRVYQVQIDPISCETPAGLQAIILRADDCTASSYQYVACQNPIATESLTLWVEDSSVGNRYLIYVDGYDGNRCTFTLSLTAHPTDPRTSEDFSRQQVDYSIPASTFEPEEMSVSSLNNEMVISWTTESQNDLSYFLVQTVYKRGAGEYGSLLGKLTPTQAVGSDQSIQYQFRDTRPLENGVEYCYRIVKLFESGERAYSPSQCSPVKRNEDFFISPVLTGRESKKYYIQFTNRKKQNLLFQVLDMQQKELKSMMRAKEPKGDGIINIDMTDFQTGRYYLKVIGKSEFYLRMFVVE
ncbi:MAG: hypothetical protein AAF587_38010 [Bacteroidota bacterium]